MLKKLTSGNLDRSSFVIILFSIPLLLIILGFLLYASFSSTSTNDSKDSSLNYNRELTTEEYMALVSEGTDFKNATAERQAFTWKKSEEESVTVNGFQYTTLKASEDLERDLAAEIVTNGIAIDSLNSYEDGNLRSRAFYKNNFVCLLLNQAIATSQESYNQVNLLCGELPE